MSEVLVVIAGGAVGALAWRYVIRQHVRRWRLGRELRQYGQAYGRRKS